MASDTPNTPNTVDPELLKILVCPLTRSPLRLEGEELVGAVGGLRYPLRDGIPVLLIDEARMPEGVADHALAVVREEGGKRR